MEEWKRRARNGQQNFANRLGNRLWNRFGPDQHVELWEMVAFALLGPPRSEDQDTYGYERDEIKIVDELKHRCLKNGSNGTVDVAFLFVFSNDESHGREFMVPLIRVRKGDDVIEWDVRCSTFIDHTGRVYAGWEEYLDKNTLNGVICVPKHGKYNYDSDVRVEFNDQSNRGKLKEILGKIATVTSLLGPAGQALTFVPLPGFRVIGICLKIGCKVVGTSTSVYLASSKLVDRYNHDLSISLSDSEARGAWLTIAASSMELLGKGMESFLPSCTNLHKIVQSGTYIVKGANGVHLVLNYVDKKEITLNDVRRIRSCIFFFNFTKVSPQTLTDSIEEMISRQKRTVGVHKTDAFDVEEIPFERQERGEQQFIVEIESFDNMTDFLNAMGI